MIKILIIAILITTVDLIDVKAIKINPNRQNQGDLIPIEYLDQHDFGSKSIQKVDILPEKDFASALQADPLLATLILSYNLHLTPKPIGFNHPQHLPLNPYVSLLLSHYGRYVPAYGYNRGIYGYAAANNYLNNLPFGSYKLYEDVDV